MQLRPGRVGSLGGGRRSLAQAAASVWGGLQPVHHLDFVADRALIAGVDVGKVTNAAGWTFTRALAATYEEANGSLTTYGSGVPRGIGRRGLLMEGARTNVFLNSDVGATQAIAVTAQAYTLSFWGTGTITLSGVSTAGPLAGTGAGNRVSLTFTPTAGSLTLTVSGSCSRVQLEAGSNASSYIATAGSSVTRPADVAGITGLTLAAPLTLAVRYRLLGLTGATMGVFYAASDGNNYAGFSSNAGTVFRAGAAEATVTQNDGTLNVTTRRAMAIATDDVRAAKNGVLGTPDTLATMPTLNQLYIGHRVGAVQTFGLIEQAAVFSGAMSNAQLQAIAA